MVTNEAGIGVLVAIALAIIGFISKNWLNAEKRENKVTPPHVEPRPVIKNGQSCESHRRDE